MDQQTQGQPGSSTSGSPNAQQTDEEKNEFFNTGRIGRRNAMPDILVREFTHSNRFKI